MTILWALRSGCPRLLANPIAFGTHTRLYASNARSLVEKIVQKFADVPGDQIVKSGDYVAIKPLHCMTHDNTSAVIKKFKGFFADSSTMKVANNRQPVFALDHNVQDTSADNLKKYKEIEAFASRFGIDFYPAGRGIGHQVMCEEGYAWPLTLAVASDSHSNMYGGLGCLGTPVVRTDAASIWATGGTWWQVPPVTRVELTGKLAPGVTGKDVIVTLCGLFNKDEVLNHAVEFTGSGVSSLSIDERLTIANMTTEWGALAGVFPVDDGTIAWLRERAALLNNRLGRDHPRVNAARIDELVRNAFAADEDARYEQVLTLELSTVRPHVSGPNHVKVMSSVAELEPKQIKIHKAYIVSCVNSRVDDLAQAAAVLRGSRVSPGVQLYISAASSEVEAESRRRGDWQALVAAGAKPLTPGCGPCIGLGTGLLEDGEVGISATNRNFQGRMGSRNAIAYLASPAVVAASAAAGYIRAPIGASSSAGRPLGYSRTVTPVAGAVSSQPVPLADGFPAEIKGEVVFCHQDNLNTDGIYPGKYTYQENITPEQQAQVVMENYDPEFGRLVRGPGQLLIGGFNFGTGSSREQAATALKHKGLPLVVAGSFSETYKRNAINNGYLLIEQPALVDALKAKFGTERLTVLTGLEARVDFRQSTVTFDGRSYPISPVGRVAQELIMLGGLEEWVARKLQQPSQQE